MRRTDEILKVKEGVFTAPVKWAKSWEELGKITGTYVYKTSELVDLDDYETIPNNKNIFATEEQAEQYGIVAAQLSQLVAQLNGEPNWKPKNGDLNDYYYNVIMNNGGGLLIVNNSYTKLKFNKKLPFPLKTKEAAEFSLKHHADLWRKFHGLS